MKKNTHETNYYTNSWDLQLLIDESFAEKVIPENDSVRLLDGAAAPYSFRRFLTLGKKNVRTETLLAAMGYNIRKLHAKIQQNQTKTQLFQKVSA